MKFELLMACMGQTDDSLIKKSKITGNVIVINQCEQEGYQEYKTENGIAKMFLTNQRGLTKSRNLAIEKSDSEICLFCDDDEIFVA